MDTMNQAASHGPGMSAEEMAAGLAGLAAPPPVEAPAPSTGVRWLLERKRVEAHELEYPFVLDGIVHRTVTIKRLTAGEVGAFMDKMRTDPGRTWRYPMFFLGADGPELSDGAWDALDDDDRFALEEILDDFLPARFKRKTSDG